jgi:hypothetical protein
MSGTGMSPPPACAMAAIARGARRLHAASAPLRRDQPTRRHARRAAALLLPRRPPHRPACMVTLCRRRVPVHGRAAVRGAPSEQNRRGGGEFVGRNIHFVHVCWGASCSRLLEPGPSRLEDAAGIRSRIPTPNRGHAARLRRGSRASSSRGAAAECTSSSARAARNAASSGLAAERT